MKSSGPAVSPKSRIGSNQSSEAEIALYMLDHTNNKSIIPDSLNMSGSQNKIFYEALERDQPAN